MRAPESGSETGLLTHAVSQWVGATALLLARCARAWVTAQRGAHSPGDSVINVPAASSSFNPSDTQLPCPQLGRGPSTIPYSPSRRSGMSQILKIRSGRSPAALPARDLWAKTCALPMGPRGAEPRDAGHSAPSTLVWLITGIDRRRWQERRHLRSSQLLFCSHLRSVLGATTSPHHFKRSYTTCAGSIRWDELHPQGLRWQQEVRGVGYGRVL